jgi:hypothetical protein
VVNGLMRDGREGGSTANWGCGAGRMGWPEWTRPARGGEGGGRIRWDPDLQSRRRRVERARSRLLCLEAKDSSWLDLSNRRVSASRDTCRCRYLVGYSCVCIYIQCNVRHSRFLKFACRRLNWFRRANERFLPLPSLVPCIRLNRHDSICQQWAWKFRAQRLNLTQLRLEML